MNLPIDFLSRMKKLFDINEYEEFIDSFNKPRYYGLRVNTLKISVEEFLKISPFKLLPIPWTKDGFYYEEGEFPGRHPYYYAGLYYIQEPSAMLPGVILDAKPGEKILDLCAAPGGKTVQIGAGLKGQGLLVANDVNSDRVKGLIKNIELYGIRNALVTNETPSKLSINFKDYFDKILIDAPCSGEGMLRKDDSAAKGMESFTTEKCSVMQWEILYNAGRMLKNGGSLVYSTCTFSPEEDEKMISRFLSEFSGYELVDIPKIHGIEGGRPEWCDGNEELRKAARLWPHRIKGEGHFVALIRKTGEQETDGADISSKPTNIPQVDLIEAYRAFEKENLNIIIEGEFFQKGASLYCLPISYPDLSGQKTAKFGWYLGDYAHNKFEPSHSLIISLNIEDIKRVINLEPGVNEVNSYLKGETLFLEAEKGYTGICINGYTLGWGKHTGSFLKNMFPKGWRRMK